MFNPSHFSCYSKLYMISLEMREIKTISVIFPLKFIGLKFIHSFFSLFICLRISNSYILVLLRRHIYLLTILATIRDEGVNEKQCKTSIQHRLLWLLCDPTSPPIARYIIYIMYMYINIQPDFDFQPITISNKNTHTHTQRNTNICSEQIFTRYIWTSILVPRIHIHTAMFQNGVNCEKSTQTNNKNTSKIIKIIIIMIEMKNNEPCCSALSNIYKLNTIPCIHTGRTPVSRSFMGSVCVYLPSVRLDCYSSFAMLCTNICQMDKLE